MWALVLCYENRQTREHEMADASPPPGVLIAGAVGMYGRRRAAIFEQLLEFEPGEKAKLVDAPRPRELVTEEPVIDPQTGEPRRDGQGNIIMRPVVPPVLTPRERLWERLPRIMGDDEGGMTQ